MKKCLCWQFDEILLQHPDRRKSYFPNNNPTQSRLFAHTSVKVRFPLFHSKQKQTPCADCHFIEQKWREENFPTLTRKPTHTHTHTGIHWHTKGTFLHPLHASTRKAATQKTNGFLLANFPLLIQGTWGGGGEEEEAHLLSLAFVSVTMREEQCCQHLITDAPRCTNKINKQKTERSEYLKKAKS